MADDTKIIAVVGNCQSRGIADYLAVMYPNASVRPAYSQEVRLGVVDLEHLIGVSDIVVVQTTMLRQVKEVIEKIGCDPQLIVLPTIYHTGFHPDFIYVSAQDGNLASPIGPGHSAIGFAAWKAGMIASEAVQFFNDVTMRGLGYDKYLAQAKQDFMANAKGLGYDFTEEYSSWEKSGVFLHTPNHPKPIVLAGLARAAASKMDAAPTSLHPEYFVADKLWSNLVWPIYPELAQSIGYPGEYLFKPPYKSHKFGQSMRLLNLHKFLGASFAIYDKYDRSELNSVRLLDERYEKFINKDKLGSGVARKPVHPYRGLPDMQFWNRSVASVAPKDMDPVSHARTKITPPMKIATAGSCFAQHIARALQETGFTYHVEEKGADLDPTVRQERQFGVFSARYGNIYTAAQLDQMFDRATGNFVPVDKAWQRADGRFVDPFRPRIEPDGFESAASVAESQTAHFEAVERLWKNLDVFIFTLGLTEGWRSKIDGAVFPLAPGVAGGEMDYERYEFHNFTAEETAQSTISFLQKLKSVNPNVRVILTVSPVPLEATYENRHVLVSTAHSKAALLVAAHKVTEKFDWVEYFPSYEIITGSYNRGSYFGPDLREVVPSGVSHVMERFIAHHTLAEDNKSVQHNVEYLQGQNIICDEELLRV